MLGKTTTTERILYYTGKSHKLEVMMVLQQWTGWNKNKKEVLQLPQQQLLVFGMIIGLILLILRSRGFYN